MKEDCLHNNLLHLPEPIRDLVTNANYSVTIEHSRSGAAILAVDGKYLHSRQDPLKEAGRVLDSADFAEEKILLFFGAGLGYSVLQALENNNNQVVWMEPFPFIIKQAFGLFDFSSHLASGKLKIILPPFNEDDLFSIFKGLGNLPVRFISHRASLAWKEKEYSQLRFIAEKFFKKKDVNIATLSRFETIWTRNMLQNIPELLRFAPVSSLFGIAKELPIVVCGAGPSLYHDLENLQIHRDSFILIAVDTAVAVLNTKGIDPDLIFSVDPQYINTRYLENYHGNGLLVFDPTSSYHTLRIPRYQKGFVTSSPFPLLKILTEHTTVDIGQLDFGGSVSTNAVSLAEAIGGKVFLLGQDLAFTGGLAHARGAVLEESLNFSESRKQRREKHNHKQIHFLPKIKIHGINNQALISNEKLQIFRKWFAEKSSDKSWTNLTSAGADIPGIPHADFASCFNDNSQDIQGRIQDALQKIKSAAQNSLAVDRAALTKFLSAIITELKTVLPLYEEGIQVSKNIYTLVEENSSQHDRIRGSIQRMAEIDEIASSKQGLNDIIGTSMQRVILMITEGYEASLATVEKMNENLATAKKSILLYEALYNSAKMNLVLLKKTLARLEKI